MERNWTKTICNVFFNHVLSRRSKLKSQIHAQKWQFKTKLITLSRCYAPWSDSFHQMILVLTSVGDTVSLVRTYRVDIHRACCTDRATVSVTDKGLSSRMISTACGPDPLVRADDSQHKHSTGSRFAILAKSGLFWGVYHVSNLCLYHAKLLAIDAWKPRQKILRKGEVHCSEKSTRLSHRPNNWGVWFYSFRRPRSIGCQICECLNLILDKTAASRILERVLWISSQKNTASGVIFQTWRVH